VDKNSSINLENISEKGIISLKLNGLLGLNDNKKHIDYSLNWNELF
jgi:hypothetical protein